MEFSKNNFTKCSLAYIILWVGGVADLSAILNVSEAMKNPGQSIPFETELTLEAFERMSDPVRFDNIRVKGTLMYAEGTINLRGVATAKVVSRCYRCLEDAECEVVAELDDAFVREASPANSDLYTFEATSGSGAYSISLEEPVRSALILELPMRILCSEDCKGLCTQCGHNLNEGPCSCHKGAGYASDNEDVGSAEVPEVISPFSALKTIVENNEEV